jgi:hypothetical protein
LCGKTVLGHKDSDDPNSAHVEEGVKIKPVTVGTFHRSFAEAGKHDIDGTATNWFQSSSWTRRAPVSP